MPARHRCCPPDRPYVSNKLWLAIPFPIPGKRQPLERDTRQEASLGGWCGRLALALDGDRHGNLSTDLNPCRRSGRGIGRESSRCKARSSQGDSISTGRSRIVSRSLVAKSSPHCLTNRSRVYLAFGAAGMAGFENSAASNFAFITTFSIIAFSGGTGVSLNPRAVLLTGRTLVSRTNGISRPFTFR